MTTLSAPMDAALAGPVVTIFGAIEIVLPTHTIRLIDGSGTVTFDGKTFAGADATYGVIESIEDLTDGNGDQAPAVMLTLNPASDAAAADLASAAMQGAPVSMWLGVVDPATGQVIGEPQLEFLGSLDVPTLKVSANDRKLDIEISSEFESFFLTDDGARLSDTFHQYLWPGETGLAEATGVLQQIYWGGSPPSGVSK